LFFRNTWPTIKNDLQFLRKSLLDKLTYSLQCSKGSRLGHDCAYQ
jgi:hypothetical protein